MFAFVFVHLLLLFFVIILNLHFLFIQGDNKDNKVFKWSQEDQGVILSSFFWGYFITQIPGGILSQRYGGKYVFMLGILFSAVCSLLTPNVVRLGIEHVGIFKTLAASSLGADFFYFAFNFVFFFLFFNRCVCFLCTYFSTAYVCWARIEMWNVE